MTARHVGEQVNVRRAELLAPLRDPLFVRLLGKERPLVERKRCVEVSLMRRCHECCDVDAEAVGRRENYLLAACQKEARVRRAPQVGLERAPQEVDGFVKAVPRRVGVRAGPEDLHELLRVQPVARLESETLQQERGFALTPPGIVELLPVDCDAERAEKANLDRSRPGGLVLSHGLVRFAQCSAETFRRVAGSSVPIRGLVPLGESFTASLNLLFQQVRTQRCIATRTGAGPSGSVTLPPHRGSGCDRAVKASGPSASFSIRRCPSRGQLFRQCVAAGAHSQNPERGATTTIGVSLKKAATSAAVLALFTLAACATSTPDRAVKAASSLEVMHGNSSKARAQIDTVLTSLDTLLNASTDKQDRK